MTPTANVRNHSGHHCLARSASLGTYLAYKGFEPYEIKWTEFVAEWIPVLLRDGLLAGVNWSGPYAKGYDIEPDRLRNSVEAVREDSSS